MRLLSRESSLPLLAIPAAALAAAPLGFADTTPVIVHIDTIAPPASGPGSSGTYERADSGDFNSDNLADLVVLRDSTLLHVPGADVYTTVHVVGEPADGSPIDANDFAVLDGSSIAVVDAGGLRILDLSSAPNTWGETVLNTTTWANAGLVRCDDVNLDGDADIIGVASNGVDVLTMMSDGLGGFSAGSSFTSPATVVDLVAMEWRSAGIKEIVVLTTGGFRVHDLQTSEITHRNSPLWRDAIAVLPGLGGELDRLAWLTGHPNGTDSILLVTNDLGDEPTLFIDDELVTAASSGDLNGDGSAELVVRYSDGDINTFFNARVENYIGTNSFSLTHLGNDLVEAGASPMTPTVHDFAGNGFGDVVTTDDAASGDVLYLRDPGAPVSPYLGTGPMFNNGMTRLYVDKYSADPGLLSFSFDYFGAPEWTGEFEIAVHKQAGLGLATVEDAIYYVNAIAQADPDSWLVSVTIPYEGSGRWIDGMPVVNHLVARPIARNGDDVVWSGPPLATAFIANHPNMMSYEPYLSLATYANVERRICNWDHPAFSGITCNGGGGATPIGGQVGETQVPPGN